MEAGATLLNPPPSALFDDDGFNGAPLRGLEDAVLVPACVGGDDGRDVIVPHGEHVGTGLFAGTAADARVAVDADVQLTTSWLAGAPLRTRDADADPPGDPRGTSPPQGRFLRSGRAQRG